MKTPKTGNSAVDAFLDEFDSRIAPEDKRHPDSKERLRRMRPGLFIAAVGNPSWFETQLRSVYREMFGMDLPK